MFFGYPGDKKAEFVFDIWDSRVKQPRKDHVKANYDLLI